VSICKSLILENIQVSDVLANEKDYRSNIGGITRAFQFGILAAIFLSQTTVDD
jgi:hypothetical protein